MPAEKEIARISKFLSLVLRHQPETIGIITDENGWTDVDILIGKMKSAGTTISIDLLKTIVETSSKKRFAFSDDLQKIRANQGHSMEIELGYKPCIPPDILYHGTGQKSVDSILQTGLEKRNRHHVHLSDNKDTAINVGQRHGKPVVITVMAAKMHTDGFLFYLSANGVWLTKLVPVKYLVFEE